MNYYDKYIKYKKKYVKLKKSYGGNYELENYEINTSNNNIIKISYAYNTFKNYIKIKNFTIHYNDIKIDTLHKKFMVNKTFFKNELNIKNKIKELGKYSNNKYNFDECENTITPLEYLAIKNNTDVKTFIESYFRKNICIITQDDELLNSELVYYHEIIKLYVSLCIIHNYNKIELMKYNKLKLNPTDTQIIKINKKYDKIYKNIPKYIESDIAHDKISFNVNGSEILLASKNNGIDGNELKVIFDTGNSSISLISYKMLKYLGIYDDNNKPKPEMINKCVFLNFGRTLIHGLSYTHHAVIKTELILLKYKFTDPKLKNDKEYKIVCFPIDKPDMLLGQNTMYQLYEDGYSIKWYNNREKGEKKREDYKQLFNELINDKSIIDDLLNGKVMTHQNIIDVCRIIIDICMGMFFDISDVNSSDIIHMRQKLNKFYKFINDPTKLNPKNKDYIYSIFENMYSSWTKDYIDGIIKN
jgi:hypothetical protein